MKNESIDLLKLGVSMGFLAILLTYVLFTVVLGKNIGNVFLSKTDEIQVATEVGALKELSNLETIMPAATAFSLLEYQKRNIRQITCYVCEPVNGEVRTIYETLCIASHLKGSVKLYIEYNNTYGLYDISIWPE